MRLMTILGLIMVTATIPACGGKPPPGDASIPAANSGPSDERELNDPNRATIWDVLGPDTSEQVTNVNRYLWAASLDVLSFLPVQEFDSFTGVILTGYGKPPGGERQYRATIHIKDPALAARSLSVSLQTSGGDPVSAATTRAVENAILSRARQLRIADNRL